MSDSKPSLAARIAQADDIGSELVQVPEWGVEILLKSPTLRRRFEYLAWRNEIEEEGSPEAMERLWLGALICVAHDPETGDPAFTFEDVDLLASKASVLVERVAFKAMTVMGLTKESSDFLSEGSSTAESEPTSSL